MPSVQPTEYGTKIATQRRRMNLSVRALALKVKLDMSTIYAIENGRIKDPLPNTRKALDNYFHKNLPAEFKLIDPIKNPKKIFDPFTGAQLRQIRVQLGLTQMEFAAKVKFNVQQIALWEGGSRYPSITSVQRLRDNVVNLIADHITANANRFNQQLPIDFQRPAVIPPRPYTGAKRGRKPKLVATPSSAINQGATTGVRLVVRSITSFVPLDDLTVDKFYGVEINGVRGFVMKTAQEGQFTVRTFNQLMSGNNELVTKSDLKLLAEEVLDQKYEMKEFPDQSSLISWLQGN